MINRQVIPLVEFLITVCVRKEKQFKISKDISIVSERVFNVPLNLVGSLVRPN